MKKKCDYHMHPNLTNNYKAADAFIEKAISEGFEEICFTDHMPLSISDAGDRIKKGMIKKYYKAVKEKAKEYEGRIIIKTGIEIDYHPDFISEIEFNLGQADFDIVLGATHFHLPGLHIITPNMTPNEYAALSFENSLQAIKSGYFDILTHLDLQRWVYTLPARFPMQQGVYAVKNHQKILNEIMKELEKTKVKLEINSHAFVHNVEKDGMYPSKDIMDLSYKYDVEYVFGSDAHTSDRVGYGYDIIKNSTHYQKAFA